MNLPFLEKDTTPAFREMPVTSPIHQTLFIGNNHAIQNISFNEQLKIFYAFNVIIGLSFILFLMGFDLGPGMGPRFMGHLVGPYEVAGLSLVSIILLRRENFVKNAKMYKYFSVFIIFATQTKSTMLSLISYKSSN